MNRNAKCIDVRTADGKLMFSLHLYDEEATAAHANGGSAGQATQADPQNHRTGNDQKGVLAMTEAQKRYLFRILAEHGFEGDDAHRRLKERFGVDALTDVSKREASSMIEQLLEEADAK
jgi:hypothetical protein